MTGPALSPRTLWSRGLGRYDPGPSRREEESGAATGAARKGWNKSHIAEYLGTTKVIMPVHTLVAVIPQ